MSFYGYKSSNWTRARNLAEGGLTITGIQNYVVEKGLMTRRKMKYSYWDTFFDICFLNSKKRTLSLFLGK